MISVTVLPVSDAKLCNRQRKALQSPSQSFAIANAKLCICPRNALHRVKAHSFRNPSYVFPLSQSMTRKKRTGSTTSEGSTARMVYWRIISRISFRCVCIYPSRLILLTASCHWGRRCRRTWWGGWLWHSQCLSCRPCSMWCSRSHCQERCFQGRRGRRRWYSCSQRRVLRNSKNLLCYYSLLWRQGPMFVQLLHKPDDS